MTFPQQPVLTKPDSGSTFIHSASTVTSSGSTVVSGVGSKELTLVVNVTATPMGTTPTLTYTLQEVDPGDQTAVFGPTASTAAINAIGVYTISLGATTGGSVKVSWTITGAGASFTGVYSTASTKVGTASNASGAITVTGTVTNASTSTNNAAIPTSSTQVGGSDGTNLQAARVFDADTGGGTQYVLGVGLRKAASGGSVEAGTSSDPLRVDPTGATTQPISAASLPLPSGAATAAKQPALGTAGSASSDVITVQGIASMTAIRVDGSAVTQPVSGTVTANIGTSGALALDATLTGGTQVAQIRSGAKGSSAAALITSTASGANHQPVDVAIYDASGNQITSFGGGTQFADGAARGSATGTLMMVDDGTNIQSASGDSSGRLNVNINTGTVTANIGTSGSLALDATLTGGTQKAITRGGAKGSTTAADVTSTASGANRQPLDVAIYDASGNQITTFGGGTQFADGTARGTATGTLMMVDDGTNIQSASGDSSGRLNTLSRVTDGTNTAAVKAASTAAVASDPALVVAISPNNSLTVAPSTSSTATLTNVAGSASSVQLLASNAARKGATVHNDSSSALYIKLGTTASTSSFTVRLLAQAYYEVPFTYTGRIDGIWSSATGNARITELT